MSLSITKDEVRKVILVYLKVAFFKDKKKRKCCEEGKLGDFFFHSLLFAKLSTEKKN